MSYSELKQRVFQANLDLVKAGLVILTWGNASGADRARGIIAIKPSGVAYDRLAPNDIVVLEIATGRIVEGAARPSSDTPTHLELYRQFPACAGVVHTHSLYGTSFAQARREIPCLGTTHADNFYGPIPVTRPLAPAEIETDYELNCGKVIVRRFTEGKIDPAQVCGVLVAGHGPFAWGPSPEKAVENAIVLEFSAQMALNTFQLNPDAPLLEKSMLDKHYLRKHGVKAYYGQPK